MKKIASVDFLIHALTKYPKGPSILGNLHLKEFEQTSSLLQSFWKHQYLM